MQKRFTVYSSIINWYCEPMYLTVGCGGDPVETKSPNSSYKPALEGQTRVGSVKTATPVEAKLITTELKSPWGIAVLPDGRFLVTEKRGQMRIVSTTGQVTEAITGIPEVNPAGQGGLLGLTLDPAFASNKIVYWVFSEQSTEGNVTAVAKGKLSADEKSIENVRYLTPANPVFKSTLITVVETFDKTGHL